MQEKASYSENLDTIIALVTHLAMTRHKSRTSENLSKYLALDLTKVQFVLDNFNGLFRKSRTTTEKNEHFYTLQLRYARRWLDKNDQSVDEDDQEDADPREPLEAEYISTLLGFITNMVEIEHAAKRQNTANSATIRGAWLAAIISSIAALIAGFSAIMAAIVGK